MPITPAAENKKAPKDALLLTGRVLLSKLNVNVGREFGLSARLPAGSGAKECHPIGRRYIFKSFQNELRWLAKEKTTLFAEIFKVPKVIESLVFGLWCSHSAGGASANFREMGRLLNFIGPL